MIERINNSDTYRLQVQTDQILPAHDINFNPETNKIVKSGGEKLKTLSYEAPAIEQAVDGLKGKFVYDTTVSNHGKTNGTTKEHKFAQIVDTHYNDGTALVDVDVFDKSYTGVLDQMKKSLEQGLPIDEGFSTETKINSKNINKDSKHMDIDNFNYTGLVMTERPRDYSGVVDKLVVNSIRCDDENGECPLNNDNNGRNKMADNELQGQLVQALTDKNTLTTEKANLENSIKDKDIEIDNLKKELSGKETEIKGLNNTIQDYEKAEKETNGVLVNSILEHYPEAERTAMKPIYEPMNNAQLTAVNNSLSKVNEEEEPGEELMNGIFAIPGTGNPSGKSKSKKVGKSDYEKANGVSIANLWNADQAGT